MGGGGRRDARARRRGWTRGSAAVAIALGIAACGSSGPGSTTPTPDAAYSVPRLGRSDLHGCGERYPRAPGFRCGEIKVPLERKDPSLGTISIGFAVRAPSRSDLPAGTPIFAVEGGPGYASTGSSKTYVHLFGGLLRTHPLVLVDMRGTGRSGPVRCPDLQRGRAPDQIALPECAAKLGPTFASYRTSAAADDIDDVRTALGYGRIALYGDSYGTYLSQSYAFRHPDSLSALVLDSAYPVSGESAWYPSLPRTGIRSLALACKRAPDCHGDMTRFLARLAGYLRSTRRGVGPLIDAIASAGYRPPDAYLRIIRAGRQLMRQNPDAWNHLTKPPKPGGHHLRAYSSAGEEIPSCNDYPMIWDKNVSEPERRTQLQASIERHAPGTFKPFTPREIALSSHIGYLYCLTFPKPTALYEPPVAPGAKPTGAPVLVVSGEMDDVTTPHEGKRVAAEFPNSKQIVIRNAGHVDALYHLNGEAANAIRRFLRSLTAA